MTQDLGPGTLPGTGLLHLFHMVPWVFKAAATAYVLLGLIVPKLVGGQKNNMPAVLQKAGPKTLTSPKFPTCQLDEFCPRV